MTQTAGNRRWWVATSILIVAALSGCSGGIAEPSPNSTHQGTPTMDETMDLVERIVSCLVEQGWEVRATPDGGIRATYPNDQSSAYQQAQKDCEDRAGHVPSEYTPPSQAEVRVMYSRLLELAECLRQEGFDPGPIPSEQAYADSILGGGGQPFDPYRAIWGPPPTITEAQYYELLRVCPQPRW